MIMMTWKWKLSKLGVTSHSFSQHIHWAATLSGTVVTKTGTNISLQLACTLLGRHCKQTLYSISYYGELIGRQIATVNGAGWSGEASLLGDQKQEQEEGHTCVRLFLGRVRVRACKHACRADCRSGEKRGALWGGKQGLVRSAICKLTVAVENYHW